MKRDALRGFILTGTAIVALCALPAPLRADLACGTKVVVAAESGYRFQDVEQIGFRDRVHALVKGEQGPEWKAHSVKYSYGTGPEYAHPAIIRVSFGEGESQCDIAVTDDHLFLVTGGSLGGGVLKRAKHLVPGADMLVDPRGNEIPIRSITFATLRGGVHHIATGTNLDDTWEGHLIVTNGVVSGDYLLQLAYPK